MITKIERTQSSAKQKKDLTQNTHNEWNSASTNSHQIGIQSKTQRIIPTGYQAIQLPQVNVLHKDGKIKYANDQEADEQLVIIGTSHTMSGSLVKKYFDDQSQCKAHASP